ncbi:MAG: glycosyltransferase family 2 protein [Sulfuricaulis sp.]|uniref:glycosyltransferase family 2 protein n=1 Tax=Sulfuricaulis sp. TaxID=2003553 RepID=UPI0034A20C2C
MVKNSNPIVTIGIPTYNRANGFLRETLESALAQTYQNIEIVVADNCSPDNTREVVAGYSDQRIRYFRHKTGMKPNDNFNFCLQQAHGVYFLMLPDDDKIDRDFVETCMHAAGHSAQVGIIRTGTRIINANGTVINEGKNLVAGLSTADFFLGWFSGKTPLYVCSTLYHCEGLKRIGGLHSRHNLFQDVAATAKLAATMGRIDIEETKASARQHGGKWTHVARVREWCEDSLELLDLLCELAPDKQAEVRNRGLQFFANVNYSRASDVRAPGERLKAYMIVYRQFNRQYFPPVGMLFHSTSLYRSLRYIKRKIMGMPAWVE